jgi:protein Tex
MGLDPEIRTGVKVAVVDRTGKVLDTTTVYPFQPRNDLRGAQTDLAKLIARHKIELIAIGNGTGSRETGRLVTQMLTDMPSPKPLKATVSEAGARSIPRPPWPRRNFQISTSRSAAPSRSPAVCRPPGRTGED